MYMYICYACLAVLSLMLSKWNGKKAKKKPHIFYRLTLPFFPEQVSRNTQFIISGLMKIWIHLLSKVFHNVNIYKCSCIPMYMCKFVHGYKYWLWIMRKGPFQQNHAVTWHWPLSYLKIKFVSSTGEHIFSRICLLVKFLCPSLKCPPGDLVFGLSVCPVVRNSVPLTHKMQYLKFYWSYSNQTWTESSSKSCSHFTDITCPWGWGRVKM